MKLNLALAWILSLTGIVVSQMAGGNVSTTTNSLNVLTTTNSPNVSTTTNSLNVSTTTNSLNVLTTTSSLNVLTTTNNPNVSTMTNSPNVSTTTNSPNVSTTTNSLNVLTTTNSLNVSKTTISQNASAMAKTTTISYVSATANKNNMPVTLTSCNETSKCNITFQDDTLQCYQPQNQSETIIEISWYRNVDNKTNSTSVLFIRNNTWPNNTLYLTSSSESVNYTCALRYAKNETSRNKTTCCSYVTNKTDTTIPRPDNEYATTAQYSTGKSLSKGYTSVPTDGMSSEMETDPTSLHPSVDPVGEVTKGGEHVLTVVGIVLGILAAFSILAALVFFLYKRKKKRTSERGHHTSHPALPPGHHPSVTIFTNWKQPDQKPNALEEIPRKNIVFLQTIGKGMFGTVVKADVLNINNIKGVGSKRWTTVAIKMTLLAGRVHEDAKTDFLAELALMKSIPAHANIIKIHGSCTAHDPYLMILEFASHGDLKKYLQDQRMERNYANAAFSAYGVKPGTNMLTTAPVEGIANQCYTLTGNDRYVAMTTGELLTSRTLLSFALQISRGLEHLAVNKIVHRDVAARNILLFEHNVVKISDFGLARRVGQTDVYERTRKGLLPVRWMSPEALFYNQFSQASDVWSYGVFLWELVTLGSTPYPSLDTNHVLDKIKTGELLTCPPHTSDVINELMLSCWISEFSKRPTFQEVCAKLEKLLEAQVEYVDLDQMDDHEYSTLDD